MGGEATKLEGPDLATGVPLVGAYMVWIANWFFGVEYWMGAVAIPMVFVFTLIGVNSTALTSITPTGPRRTWFH